MELRVTAAAVQQLVVIAVLDQVEDPLDSHPFEHPDILLVEWVGADQQAIEHIRETVGPEPLRHVRNDGDPRR